MSFWGGALVQKPTGSPVCVPVEETASVTHLFLLSPLPAYLSVGCSHGLDHECRRHVTKSRRGGNKYKQYETGLPVVTK